MLPDKINSAAHRRAIVLCQYLFTFIYDGNINTCLKFKTSLVMYVSEVGNRWGFVR